MATRDPKTLRSIAYSLMILAGLLILRDFDIGEGSHRAGTAYVDSSATYVTAHRPHHDPSDLIDLTPRLENLQFTEASTYGGTGRNVFEAEVKPSHGTILPPHEFPEQKSPPLVVPASLPLKLFGFSRDGNTRSIFLLKENDVFIAHEGDIVDRRYKILRIAQNSAQVEDMLSNQRHELWFKEKP